MRGFQAYRLLIRAGAARAKKAAPGVHIAESVDALLFSLVLLVLAVGTASLFLTVDDEEGQARISPNGCASRA